jgi:putative spermidine/putrescine transport system permease protein
MSSVAGPGGGVAGARPGLLTALGWDGTTLLVLPAAFFVLALFIYPFLYGLTLSLMPATGGVLANYARFFSDGRFYNTIGTTLWIALPATLANVFIALPIAFALRKPSRYQRAVTAILVVPITLGTVLVAQGLLGYLGPNGWFNRVVIALHLSDVPLHLTHNYIGVLLSLIITGFPFSFLLTLSYVTGIDPTLAKAAATLGAGPWSQFKHIYLPLLAPGLAIGFCLAFVQAFAVFPSAVLLGAPAGPTRVISIAAYQSAFEDYDYSMASTVAMVMGAVQLIVVGIVLGLRSTVYRGPVGGAKG